MKPILVTISAKPMTPSRRPIRPGPTTIKAEVEIIRMTDRTRKPSRISTTPPDGSKYNSTTRPHPIIPGHPEENEIPGSSNVQREESHSVNIPQSIDGDRRDTYGARLNLGAIVALGAFGGFIFLAAIITTIIVLVRRWVLLFMCLVLMYFCFVHNVGIVIYENSNLYRSRKPFPVSFDGCMVVWLKLMLLLEEISII